MADQEANIIRDQDSIIKYYARIPNIVDDLDLSVYAYRLYGHMRRVAGESGYCEQSTATLSKKTKMSAGKITEAKIELQKAGLIDIETKKRGNLLYHYITIINIWQRNYDTYAQDADQRSQSEQVQRSCDELSMPLHERSMPPRETKNKPIKNNQLKINNDLTPEFSKTYGDLEQVFVQETKSPLLSPNPRKWGEGFEAIVSTGIAAEDFREVIRQYLDKGYAFNGPGSFVNWCVNFMARKNAEKPKAQRAPQPVCAEEWRGH